MQTRKTKRTSHLIDQNQNQTTSPFNFAVFDESMTKQIQSKLIKTRKTNILNQNMWTIQYGMFVRQKWADLFSYMKECSSDRLDLHDNKEPSIIHDLSHPVFTNIVSLVLQKNRIVSIEAFAFLQMDMLNFIDLDDNLITLAKPMNKLKWAFLRKIELRSNYILESDFTRIKNQEQIHKIYLDEQIDERIICQDLVFLFKIQGTALFKLRRFVYMKEIKGKSRIHEYKKIDCLIRKFKPIHVSSWH